MGFGVARSTILSNAKDSVRGTDNRQFYAFIRMYRSSLVETIEGIVTDL